MSKTAIIYGSTTGNTENAANQLAGLLKADVFDVSSNPCDALNQYDNLILGTSTWGAGDLQDDWEDFISELEVANLNGKVVAIFGFGDACSNPDTFVDGMGTLYKIVKNKACKLIGSVDTYTYDFEKSKAVVGGKFIGLALDEENQGDLTEDRINKWAKQIIPVLL
ncbi:flavodoxin [Marinifilum sp.]|uniref:flavodoxin n=1 Tax=Marinifilum sp. TaxID=2033137 RepID=UPI003BAAD9D7